MTCGKGRTRCGYVDKSATSYRPLTCGDAVYPPNPVDERLGVEAPMFDNFHMPEKSP